MIRKIALISALALGLAACQTTGPKQTGGTLLGGIGGAVAGAQFGSGKGQIAAVAAGTLLGALVGSEVGKSLDRADKLAMERSTQSTLERQPTGTTASWSNPDSGNSGTVTPTRTYQAANGTYCREYQQTVTIAGETQDAFGRACRQPDGSWRIID